MFSSKAAKIITLVTKLNKSKKWVSKLDLAYKSVPTFVLNLKYKSDNWEMKLDSPLNGDCCLKDLHHM